MARWAAFLADPAARRPGRRGARRRPPLDEMRWPLTITDETLWAAGFGLGLILVPQGGAGGARRARRRDARLPGRRSYGRRGGDGTPGRAGLRGARLVRHRRRRSSTCRTSCSPRAVEHDPAEIEPWAPGRAAPAAYRVGARAAGGARASSTSSRWHDGTLQARGADDAGGPAAGGLRAVPDQPDVLRTVSGREAGELLRLTRDDGRRGGPDALGDLPVHPRTRRPSTAYRLPGRAES